MPDTHEQTSSVYKGVVASRKAINRFHVQIRLKDDNRAFELVVNRPWVIQKGDEVRLGGGADDRGVIVCRSYKNVTQGVSDHKELPAPLIAIFPTIFGVIFFSFGFVVAPVLSFVGGLLTAAGVLLGVTLSKKRKVLAQERDLVLGDDNDESEQGTDATQ